MTETEVKVWTDDKGNTVATVADEQYTFRRLKVGDIHDMELYNSNTKDLTNTKALYWLAAKLSIDSFLSWDEFCDLDPTDLEVLGTALKSFLPQLAQS